MNDRFRFRAIDNRDWADEKGKIYYDAQDAYDWGGGEPEVPARSFGSIVDCEGWIVEQCTGLKDKNGRLIYEGDIVKEIPKELCIDSYFYDEYTYKVVFWYGRFVYTPLDVNYAGQGDTFDFEFDKYDYEVIGNIHENPELLEDK